MPKKVRKFKKKDISELVDSKGGKLTGDEHVDQSGAATSNDTTDDHVTKTRQGVSMYRRYYSEDEDEELTLDEVSKNKMKNVIEDIMSKTSYSRDVIDNLRDKGGVPDVDVLKDSHPVLVRKVSHIKSLMDRDDMGGDEKAILINSLLSINLSDIPTEYKKELIRKLG